MVKAQQVTDPLCYHGEGAVWFEGWGGLKWVDMLAGDVLSLDATTGAVSRLHVDSPVAAMVRPRVGGGFVVATEREFALWRDDMVEWVSPELWADGDRRFNEGGCDPRGELICGMKSTVSPGNGDVFRLSPDRSIDLLFGGATVSNGLGFTADGSRMYYNDSRTRRTDVFDVADGVLTNRRPFVEVPDGAGGPDGLWVDAADGIWVAMFRGSAVRHYNSDGVLEDVVELPVSQVSSCTFGGSDLRTLYITTSRENLDDGVEPLAGSVFGVEVGVRGQPVIPFAG
ncbi:MAG: SMP-30/gluconolactonase/LRE family protein [Actinomycetota bacterium]|nr:SMP-30/gluconolactonase/LRE family protein [Actinomycetota bacterium]